MFMEYQKQHVHVFGGLNEEVNTLLCVTFNILYTYMFMEYQNSRFDSLASLKCLNINT